MSELELSWVMNRMPKSDDRCLEIMSLPNVEKVRDYFLWRQEDAHRNSLNSYCYWTLRKEGKSVQEATAMLEGKSVSFKNELLFSKGINFDKLPSWQKRGIGR